MPVQILIYFLLLSLWERMCFCLLANCERMLKCVEEKKSNRKQTVHSIGVAVKLTDIKFSFFVVCFSFGFSI